MFEERLIKTMAEYLSYFTEIKFEDHKPIELNLVSSFLINLLSCMEVGTSKDDLTPFKTFKQDSRCFSCGRNA